MKIVQSYSQFNDGCRYAGSRLNGTEVYLNFYTFLLSYLTLKKYYGSVTMYCNKKAYDTFIKYIPYENVVIKENKYSQEYWSAYKLDVIEDMEETFIHVDSDVFIFDDLFKPFIENKNGFDIIVQHTNPPKLNGAKGFVKSNSIILNNCNVIKFGKYDDKCFSCGVLGMNVKTKNLYISDVKKIYDLMQKKIFRTGYESYRCLILEELTFYLTAINNELKWHNILPYGDIVKHGEYNSGNISKYTHMWFDTKFVKRNIELILNKIKKDFEKDYYLVENYNKEISKINIKYLNHVNKY